MIFSYNFYKFDKFILKFFSRILLNKLLKNNKLNKFPQFTILNHDYVSNDIIVDGYYEIKELKTLCEWLKYKKKINYAVDIGAYLGNHSVFFSEYFNQVLSFEPNSFSFKLLKMNTENKKNIKIQNLGLLDKSCIKNFYSYHNNYGGSGLKKNPNIKKEFDILKAKFIKFDNLNIKKKIDLIKIDVEGSELKVLRGMQKYLQNTHPIIVFECQADEIKNGSTKVIEFLRKNGYKNFYSIENNKNINKNILSKVLDIFQFIFISRKKYIVKREKFEKKFYSFIIAEYK